MKHIRKTAGVAGCVHTGLGGALVRHLLLFGALAAAGCGSPSAAPDRQGPAEERNQPAAETRPNRAGWIAFEGGDESRRASGNTLVVCLVRADGTGLRVLDDGDEPEPSPDGKWLAYNRRAGTGAGALRQVATDKLLELPIDAGSYIAPAWDPAGHKTAWAQKWRDFDVAVYDRTTDEIDRLKLGGEVSDLQWSPDGLKLFYIQVAHGEQVSNDVILASFSLYYYSTESREASRVCKFFTRTSEFALSADSQRVAAVFATQYGEGELRWVDLRDGKESVLKTGLTITAGPVWGPGRRGLLVAAVSEGTRGDPKKVRLCLVHPETGAVEELAGGKQFRRVSDLRWEEEPELLLGTFDLDGRAACTLDLVTGELTRLHDASLSGQRPVYLPGSGC